MGRPLYISTKDINIDDYDEYDLGLPPYKTLQFECKYDIDEGNYLSLFDLERNKIIDLKKTYWYHWEYYASFSPIWKERIEEFEGQVDHNEKKIVFNKVDYEEQFYEGYNYEPDEQSKVVQNKSIGIIIKKRTWEQMFSEYGKNGILDINAMKITE